MLTSFEVYGFLGTKWTPMALLMTKSSSCGWWCKITERHWLLWYLQYSCYACYHIQTVLSLTISKSWCLHQLDVKNTFLHGHLSKNCVWPIIQIVSVCSRSLCIDLSKHHVLGINDLLTMSVLLALLTVSMTTLYLSIVKVIIWPISFFIWTISSSPLLFEQLRQSIITLLSFEFSMKDLGHLSYLFRHICYPYFFRLISLSKEICRVDT